MRWEREKGEIEDERQRERRWRDSESRGLGEGGTRERVGGEVERSEEGGGTVRDGESRMRE